ncbi:RNA polymerase II holoenzyme cyclin-like subunit [Orbilia brochopaga]|uniref:RNA polymerase II holoenzyme cyclin-like subunit n=1 Tax=Orbilia brochopaga TaxID=3140254 RepID=A0AAV9V000_9PEZI
MAANFWTSTQRAHWQLTREKIADMRKSLDEEDTNRGLGITYPLPDHKQLQLYFHHCLQRLARRLQLRQQPLATAETYLKRFYLKVSTRDTNPYLMLSTCVYLACKMEECPVHIRSVVNEARALFQEFIPQDTAKLAECEFHLISELNSYLIVHHPYRTLMEVQVPLKLTTDEIMAVWSFLNDSYITDLILLYPPHTIALTAIFLAVFVRPAVHTQANLNASSTTTSMAATMGGAPGGGIAPPQSTGTQGGVVGAAAAAAVAGAGNAGGMSSARLSQMSDWFAESGVDMDAIIECTQEMISLYDTWETWTDKICREGVARLIRGRQLL